MPNTNTTLQRTAAFYHSLSKVQTESTNLAGNELYKSSHSILASDVWMDTVPYTATDVEAFNASDDVIVSLVGTTASPAFLYPLTNTNYQTWFLDTGTPVTKVDGFEPSEDWAKPLISPSDITNASGAPSFGYELQMFRRDGSTRISYDNAYYEIDYYSGLIRFQIGNTPIDVLNGLGFTFDKNSFEAAGDKVAYIQSITTGGPRALAWVYVGRFLSDINLNGGATSSVIAGDGLTSSVFGDTITLNIDTGTASGLTFSVDGKLDLSLDGTTVDLNPSGQVYAIRISNDKVYHKESPSVTNGDASATGITLTYTPDIIGNMHIFVNGQAQIIGDADLSEDCYFSRDGGITALALDSLESGDELYWNGDVVTYELSTEDIVLLTYEKEA